MRLASVEIPYAVQGYYLNFTTDSRLFHPRCCPVDGVHLNPLRLINPGYYGQKMPKWITHIELIGEAYLGYWESKPEGAIYSGRMTPSPLCIPA